MIKKILFCIISLLCIYSFTIGAQISQDTILYERISGSTPMPRYLINDNVYSNGNIKNIILLKNIMNIFYIKTVSYYLRGLALLLTLIFMIKMKISYICNQEEIDISLTSKKRI